MAGEDLGASPGGEGSSGSWRGVAASIGALLATVLLAALLFMVDASNDARDRALASERHSYDVMLLTRTVDASIARAEGALGRYVLDEQQATGTIYTKNGSRRPRRLTSCSGWSATTSRNAPAAP